ncbi:hypothetical protein KDAU_62720 [Dictyobacter aurantiacus]|uniref:Uncharacterized protein n=1 Tax=Dictyobacter aurantiacus TaxID=1936993 RepID=A0A401ZPZ2_9CHLR|nr:hypothetical protein KDAU_62720 [Dictyobacter aurantiacus]
MTKKGKTNSPIHLTLDQLQFRHLAFHLTIVDRPGETDSHRLFAFLDPTSKSLQLLQSALYNLFQPNI